MIKKTERGWPGHYILADRCQFHRNTLLELGNVRIVVSTVGAQHSHDWSGFNKVNCDSFYETMVFPAKKHKSYWEANTLAGSISILSKSRCGMGKEIEHIDDKKANDMHEKIVTEISRRMNNGKFGKER